MTDPTPPKPKGGCGCAERREKLRELAKQSRDWFEQFRRRPPNKPK